MKRRSILLFAASIAAFNVVAQDTPVQGGNAAQPGTSPAAELPPAAARYREQVIEMRSGRTRDGSWYFLRDGNLIETQNPEDKIAERWERDGAGRVTHARYFHLDRRIIDSSANELKSRGIEPDWARLGAPYDPRELAWLRKIGKTQALGQPASVYRGRMGDASVEVVWLDQARLPARVTRTNKAGKSVLTLAELHRAAPPSWPKLDSQATDEYQRIDVADLGDMESDPFVARVLRETRGGQPGGHAH